jgi:sulfite reductase (NADPH) hemoprotein beta-component
VYWSDSRGWVGEIQQAQALDDAQADAALKGAAESVERGEVVAPYVFAVRVKDGKILPTSAREIIRARGPSVRTDLGKQAA